MNTMMFCGKYFLQTKATAMKNPMAVNYVNCLMGYFETSLLLDYKKIFKKELALWLRFIDNVYIV